MFLMVSAHYERIFQNNSSFFRQIVSLLMALMISPTHAPQAAAQHVSKEDKSKSASLIIVFILYGLKMVC
jgi:hypothetical protein